MRKKIEENELYIKLKNHEATILYKSKKELFF